MSNHVYNLVASHPHNFMDLEELGRRTGLEPAPLHLIIQQLRREGVLTVARVEGRHGISPDQQRFLMDDRPGSGDRSIGFVMVRR